MGWANRLPIYGLLDKESILKNQTVFCSSPIMHFNVLKKAIPLNII